MAYFEFAFDSKDIPDSAELSVSLQAADNSFSSFLGFRTDDEELHIGSTVFRLSGAASDLLRDFAEKLRGTIEEVATKTGRIIQNQDTLSDEGRETNVLRLEFTNPQIEQSIPEVLRKLEAAISDLSKGEAAVDVDETYVAFVEMFGDCAESLDTVFAAAKKSPEKVFDDFLVEVTTQLKDSKVLKSIIDTGMAPSLADLSLYLGTASATKKPNRNL